MPYWCLQFSSDVTADTVQGAVCNCFVIMFRSPIAVRRSYILLQSYSRPRRSWSAQRPIVIKLSRERSEVCRSVCPVHCGKTADQIRMPFGIIGRTAPGMRQVVGFGDRSTGRCTFGGEFGRAVVTNGALRRTCATAPRLGRLPKLLWADLFF